MQTFTPFRWFDGDVEAIFGMTKLDVVVLERATESGA